MEILEKVLDGNNIAEAVKKVISNNGAGGIDKITIKQFKEKYINNEISFEIIKQQIRERKYKPMPVKWI